MLSSAAALKNAGFHHFQDALGILHPNHVDIAVHGLYAKPNVGRIQAGVEKRVGRIADIHDLQAAGAASQIGMPSKDG